MSDKGKVIVLPVWVKPDSVDCCPRCGSDDQLVMLGECAGKGEYDVHPWHVKVAR